jgi:hypothetical protein
MLTEAVTGELTEELRMRTSRERMRPRDSLFDFKNRIFLEFFVPVSSCWNIKSFGVRGSIVYHNRMKVPMELRTIT